MQKSTEELDRNLLDATLNDIQLMLARGQRNGVINHDLLEFLEVDPYGVTKEVTLHRRYDLPQVHRALAHCYPEMQRVRETGGLNMTDFWAPEVEAYQNPETGEEERFMSSGAIFFELPDGRRRVVVFEIDPRSRYSDFPLESFKTILLGRKTEAAQLAAETKLFREHIAKGPHYLAGRTVSGQGFPLTLSTDMTWDRVALSCEMRQRLEDNVLEFLKRCQKRQTDSSTERCIGAAYSRGVLLHGPPGNGKTALAKALAKAAIGSFVYASPGDIETVGIKQVFKLARRLSPGILFLEDIDCIAKDREMFAMSGCGLGELLVQLDGLEESNGGLVIIATTNDLMAIDPAIRERPSRFDLVLEFGCPEFSERIQILEQNLTGGDTDVLEKLFGQPTWPQRTLEEWAEILDGATGAQVKEFCVRLGYRLERLRDDVETKAATDGDEVRAISDSVIDLLRNLGRQIDHEIRGQRKTAIRGFCPA